MKLRNIILIGAAAMLGLASCSDDYLNTPPRDQMSPDGFYSTPSQCNQGVLGVYADLRYISDYEYLMMSEVRSDNMWVEPRPDGERSYSEIGTFRANASEVTFEQTWNAWYKLIYDANMALQKIEKCDFANEAIKNQFLGEAHFLRGWAYFELARLYGNVPLILEPMSSKEANNVKQTDARTVITGTAIPDLEFALDNLPEKGKMVDGLGATVTGRADKSAAQGMLARVYMQLAGFPFNDTEAESKAKTYLEQLLAKKSQYWAPTIDAWRSQWLPSNANKYSVFAIQYRTGGSGNPAIFDMSPELPPSFTSIRIFGNHIYPNKALMYQFERTQSNGSKDLRGENYSYIHGYDKESASFPTYSQQFEDVTVDGVTTSQQVNAINYKYMASKRKCKEFGIDGTIENSMVDYYDWPVNYPVIRIEDMMLLYAEILCDEGDIAGAMNQVNEIRSRAGVDLRPTSGISKDEATKYIRLERQLELFGEGVRWFDEVRYGTWQQDIINKFNSYSNPDGTDVSSVADGRYLYPIPSNQMSIVPGLYSQNKGY
ncbi:RagB/SusD family nutrient uptake outer membrane protein [Prevotella lacticifex]|uniref:Membrane protein n=1 Tax=Prevotella lacticifex TaxID=2854755 RepID=A0A9R1C8L8_9BACT|nr:RagB/SusD family nutrient uptake outer membrane protein [Prevotella lacticifex]GJG37951.1 membrane protein [Prevotella lacticifex]GJG41093.1 membrane protein [Prevotella lacticifex]GJG43434.1 membrane protein [Prevotella lacticifex]GJG47216.1 membrane protein [Prevotella lacticifex]GJG50131.1 membrane protein [Prevotella lacticifex]